GLNQGLHVLRRGVNIRRTESATPQQLLRSPFMTRGSEGVAAGELPIALLPFALAGCVWYAVCFRGGGHSPCSQISWSEQFAKVGHGNEESVSQQTPRGTHARVDSAGDRAGHWHHRRHGRGSQ